MFNECEMKTLERAVLELSAQAPLRRAFEITPDNLAAALDAAGVWGLRLVPRQHDQPRRPTRRT